MFGWLSAIFGRASRHKRRTESIGDLGERLAEEWLRQERRMRIEARNWRAPHDRRLELDIVARDGDVLVFVEVKTRPAYAMVPGYFAAVTKRKKNAVRAAARAYISQLRSKPRTVRYDVVEVVRSPEPGSAPRVEHYENVPLFSKDYLRIG